jgi:hypothetical protein
MKMPINSRDVQFGAAIGYIIIVGIVAIYFGFSTKLVLALLAGLGILFCASLVEGYVRAAMLGTGALLLLLIAYDLATSCDSACQQARAEAAQQRAVQEQTRLAASRPPTDPLCDWKLNPIVLGPEWVDIHGDRCKADLFWDKTQQVELWLKLWNGQIVGPFKWGDPVPEGGIAVMNKIGSVPASLKLTPVLNR